MDYDIEADEPVSIAVVRAVSAVVGCEPSSLPPLTRVLNPGALDSLFDSRSNGVPRMGGRVSFVYSRCRVTVDNGEYLTVRPLEKYPKPAGVREPTPVGLSDDCADSDSR